MIKTIHHFFYNHYHRRYHGKYMHAKKLFVFDLVLLAGAFFTLLAGLFFFFWKPGLTNWIDLNLSYGGERVKSGERVQLLLNYTNRSKETLTDVTLAVHLPVGFVTDRVATDIKEFDEQSTFKIDDIPPGGKGTKVLHGWLWTEPKHEEKILAILSYTTKKLKRYEQKLGSFLINLPESVIDVKITSTLNSTFPNEKIPLQISITNNTDRSLDNIHIQQNWPGQINWQNNIDTFKIDKQETIFLDGELVSPERAGQYRLQIQPQILINNQTIKLGDLTQDLNVVNPNIIITATLPATITYTEPNARLPLTIFWKNDSIYKLKKLKIKLNFSPTIVNLKETARQNNLKVVGNELVLDAENRTLLADGNPQSAGETTIDLILQPTFTINNQEKAYLEITPRLEAEINEVVGQIFQQSGNTARILLATEATLRVETRYFTTDGDQLGRGPLPPQIGETTKYWIFVQLKNTTNRLQDINFIAELAPGITLTEKQSVTVGNSLQNRNGRLYWQITQLPANSVTGWYFEVAVTPTSTQIGQNLTLLKNINLTATDAVTGKKFNLNSNAIKNNLPDNDKGSIYGSIVR